MDKTGIILSKLVEVLCLLSRKHSENWKDFEGRHDGISYTLNTFRSSIWKYMGVFRRRGESLNTILIDQQIVGYCNGAKRKLKN